MKLRYVAIAIAVALMIALATWAYASGWLSLSLIRQTVADLGPWGPIAFIGLFIAGELLQIPSVLWVMTAGLIWPFSIALALSFAGAMCAALIAFVVARRLLGRGFQKDLPSQVQHWIDDISHRGIRPVIAIRLLFFMSPLMHWVLAASTVSVRNFLIGTALGILPHLVLLVLLGDVFLRFWEEYSLWITSVAVLAFIAFVIYSRYRKTAQAREEASRDLPA